MEKLTCADAKHFDLVDYLASLGHQPYLETRIQRHPTAGYPRYRSHQPRTFARYLVNSLWGLTVQIKLGIDKRTADDIAKIILSVL
jgi:hypothetical protein